MCKGIIELQEMSKAEGKAAGKAEGEERMSKLINILFTEQRMDEIPLAASDAKHRAKLYEEYGIV